MNNYPPIVKRHSDNVNIGGEQDALICELKNKFEVENIQWIGNSFRTFQGYYQALWKGRKIFLKLKKSPNNSAPDSACVFEKEYLCCNQLHKINAKHFPEAVFFLRNGEYHCIAYEFLDGKVLGEKIENGNLSISEKANILAQLQEIIKGIWQSGIVHRDMHSYNFIVVKDGTVKLIDFGCACVFEKQPQKKFLFLRKFPLLFHLLVRQDRRTDDIFWMMRILKRIGFHENYQKTYRDFELFLQQRLGIRVNIEEELRITALIKHARRGIRKRIAILQERKEVKVA